MKNPSRQIPFIFLPPEYNKTDAQKLTRNICGNANIYFFENSSAIEEFNYYIGKSEEMWKLNYDPSKIGCYLPDIDFSEPRSFNRYRFLSLEENVDKIINGFARYSTIRPGDIDTLLGVVLERRKIKNEDLRKETTELNNWAFQENDSLEEKNGKLQKQIKEQIDEITSLQESCQNYEDNNRALSYQLQELRKNSEEKEAEYKKNQDAVSLLCKFADNLKKQLELLAELYAEKIVVLPEAYDSAEKYDLQNVKLETSWELLSSIGTILYPLCFPNDVSKKSNNLEDDYTNKCTFRLALKEGRQTNRSKDLTGIRSRHYNGRTIDISPHICYGNKEKKQLRVYFAIISESKEIVIGHCGEHLDNASTRKVTK